MTPQDFIYDQARKQFMALGFSDAEGGAWALKR